jgi:26S proteasome non-ATPase regulatory subunit 9
MVAPNVKAETMRLMDQRAALEAEMNAIIAALSAPGGPGITGGLVDAEVQSDSRFFLTSKTLA